MYGYEVVGGPSWFDTGVGIPLHSEMGTRDQANIVRLDEYEELVWVGTQRGRLLSYMVNFENGHHVPYSRFNVNLNEERVVDFLALSEGIVSMSRSSLQISSRGGVGHSLASTKAINRMTVGSGLLSAIDRTPPAGNHLVIGADITKTAFYLDTITGELSSFIDLTHNVSKIHCCADTPLMVIGGTNGQVTLVDGRIPRIVSSSQIFAHPGEISSISSMGNFVVTCGRRFSGTTLAPDVFVKVFDVRNLRQQVPLSYPSGAIKAEVSSIPSTMAASAAGALTLMVLGSHGTWHQGDLYPSSGGPNSLRNSEIFQTDCFQPHSPDLEPTVVDWSVGSDVTGLLDSAGVLHFWARYHSGYGQVYPHYRVNPNSSSVLMTAPRQPVMPSYPNVMHLHNREVESRTRIYADTVRDGTWVSSWGGRSTDEDEDFFYTKSASLKPPVPLLSSVVSNLKEWDRNLSYCPNSMGFGYNTLVANARATAVTKRSEATRHRIGQLELDDVLLEQEDAGSCGGSGGPTKRWKFTPVDFSINHSLFPFSIYNKTMRSGLENGQGQLDCLNSVVQCLYNITQLKVMLKSHICYNDSCISCELGFVFHMMDEARFTRNKVCQPVRFSRVWKKLKLGFLVDGIESVYESLVARLKSEWATNREGPLMNRIFDSALSTSSEEAATGSDEFELVSVIQHVVGTTATLPTPRSQSSGSIGHFVAVVSIFEDLDTSGGGRSRSQSVSGITVTVPEGGELEEWLLFNDFIVTQSSADEARSSAPWRRPVWSLYVNKDRLAEIGSEIHCSTKSPVTVDMFLRDTNLATSSSSVCVGNKFVPLSEVEVEQLVRGELMVALDTEFVSVGLAAIEIREDGSREIGKPGDMVVGRVSVLRIKDDANDALDGVPFIDHYVAMEEGEIKDYVTRFSGIRPGDLDVVKSLHWLVSSKSLYLKLRFLVDCGCRFVGHGLHTDFRIINLWVSSSSLIDTVELFHLQGQRFLSLKFLANRLLGRSIQSEVHCSIEDAKTALEVYRVYKQLKGQDKLEQTIKALYDSGRSSGWK